MRAHSQRRVIWILNVVLAAGVVAVVGWIFLRVRPAVADPAYVKPAFALGAVEQFLNEPPPDGPSKPAPVSAPELKEIDREEFQKPAGKRFHWLYSGPMPPPPPEDVKPEEVLAPVEDDLGKLGRVLLLMYSGPHDGQEVAADTIVFWEFTSGKKVAFSPGEFLRESKKQTGGGIKLVDVKPRDRARRIYEIHYAVHTDPETPPVKTGVYVYDGSPPEDPAVDRVVRVRSGDEGAGTSAPAASEGGSGVGVTRPPEPVPVAAGDPPPLDRLNPKIERRGRDDYEIEFDDATVQWFRRSDPDKVASSVKTQVATDQRGNVIGLKITSVSSETPADRFDVKPGDILVSINDQPVRSRSDALNIVQGLDPSISRVKVVIDRNGRPVTFNIDPRDNDTRRAARALGNP